MWGPIHDLLIHGDKVFVTVLPHTLLVLDARTGATLLYRPFPEVYEAQRYQAPILNLDETKKTLFVGETRRIAVNLSPLRINRVQPASRVCMQSWADMNENQKVEALADASKLPLQDVSLLVRVARDSAEPLGARIAAARMMSKRLGKHASQTVETCLWEIAVRDSSPADLRRTVLPLLVGMSQTAAIDAAFDMLGEENNDMMRDALDVLAKTPATTWETAIQLLKSKGCTEVPHPRGAPTPLEIFLLRRNIQRTAAGFPFSPRLGWTLEELEEYAAWVIAARGEKALSPDLQGALGRVHSRFYRDDWSAIYHLVREPETGSYSLPEDWEYGSHDESKLLTEVTKFPMQAMLTPVIQILTGNLTETLDSRRDSLSHEKKVFDALSALGSSRSAGMILEATVGTEGVCMPRLAPPLLESLTGRSFATPYEWWQWYQTPEADPYRPTPSKHP
jgi:hypothetical protein